MAIVNFSEKMLSECLERSLAPLINTLAPLVSQGREFIDVSRATQENTLALNKAIKNLTEMMEAVLTAKPLLPNLKEMEGTIFGSGK